jgi:glycogen operon protein
VNALRARQQRNFLATHQLSQGVPMLLGGDELGRTQQGNNNAYCQDNELSWFSWELSDEQRDLHDFTRRLIELRAAHAVFRRGDFLTGDEHLGSGKPDVHWFRPDGLRMTLRNWRAGDWVTLGVFLNGAEIPTLDHAGAPVVDDSFLVLFNASADDVEFRLPPVSFGRRWTHELCTAEPSRPAGDAVHAARAPVPVGSRSLKLLRRIA